MIRLAGICLLGGACALALAFWLGVATEPDLLRSGLAGWLLVIALPVGALPVLMALDLADLGATPGTRALRLLLAGLPFLAVIGAVPLAITLIAPHVLDISSLYGWSRGGTHGVAAAWFTPRWFCLRGLVYLAIWVALGLVFATESGLPSARRRTLAALGLGLHLVVGTLAALDWTMSLDLGLNSTAFGLLVISLQCAFAVTAGLLVTLAATRMPPPRLILLLLLAVVAIASFVQFTQYLVVWSANLPREIVWYQHRFEGLGGAFFVIAPVVLCLVFVTMMPAAFSRRRLPVAVAAILLLLVEGANLLLLVTPSWRGTFTVSALDGLWLVGLIGVIGACALMVTGRSREAWHG